MKKDSTYSELEEVFHLATAKGHRTFDLRSTVSASGNESAKYVETGTKKDTLPNLSEVGAMSILEHGVVEFGGIEARFEQVTKMKNVAKGEPQVPATDDDGNELRKIRVTSKVLDESGAPVLDKEGNVKYRSGIKVWCESTQCEVVLTVEWSEKYEDGVRWWQPLVGVRRPSGGTRGGGGKQRTVVEEY